MTNEKSWERYRAWLYDDADSGFRLDVSRMDLPADYPRSMARPIEAALAEMAALERGAIANPDEKRMVGHYWLRAPELAPTAGIATEIRSTLERVLDFASRVHDGRARPPREGRFRHALVVGIGGSALGPQFVAEALGHKDDSLLLHFLDNTDPDGIERVLKALPLAATLAIVISKSGGTPETRNGMLETKAAFEATGLAFGPQAVAVTQPGSKLDGFAAEQGFLERFPMWDWVGGRTSELSAVGLLPAALSGVDVQALLDGAARMDRMTRAAGALENPAALLALAWYHAGQGRGAKDMVVLPYSDRLALFSRYLQQLVMESLGKERDLDGRVVHQGLAVYGNKGSTDQHAYVQQLREGLANFFVTFVQVLRPSPRRGIEVEPGVTSGDFLNGFLIGTRRALHENGRPSLTVTIDEVSPRTIGMLIALYERAVGLYASLIRVNAYHQPGVEAGKRAAADVLRLQERLMRALAVAGTPGADCVRLAGLAESDDVETSFLLLEHLAANPDSGVAQTRGGSPFETLYRIEKGTRSGRT